MEDQQQQIAERAQQLMQSGVQKGGQEIAAYARLFSGQEASAVQNLVRQNASSPKWGDVIAATRGAALYTLVSKGDRVNARMLANTVYQKNPKEFEAAMATYDRMAERQDGQLGERLIKFRMEALSKTAGAVRGNETQNILESARDGGYAIALDQVRGSIAGQGAQASQETAAARGPQERMHTIEFKAWNTTFRVTANQKRMEALQDAMWDPKPEKKDAILQAIERGEYQITHVRGEKADFPATYGGLIFEQGTKSLFVS